MRGCVEDVLEGQEPAESASNYLLCLGIVRGMIAIEYASVF